MKLILAPMQGLIDAYMREILTDIGDYDWCVSEFIRVTDQVHSVKVLRRYIPEIDHQFRTRSGTPVHIQFLGNNPELIAENAQHAGELGVHGVDLNFGCPSKVVNQKGVGAALLDQPELIHRICYQSRKALSKSVPLSAKIRVGINNGDRLAEIIDAIESAGASFITIHARTKEDGYKNPAQWHWLKRSSELTSLPIIANGDIFDIASYKKSKQISGLDHFMLARGAVASPYLVQMIRAHQSRTQIPAPSWEMIQTAILKFIQIMVESPHSKHKAIAPRIKQWLKMMHDHTTSYTTLYEAIRTERDLGAIIKQIESATFPTTT